MTTAAPELSDYFRLVGLALAHTDDVNEALEAAKIALTLPRDASFAFDFADKKTQGILNRVMEAAKVLSVRAQFDLQHALDSTDVQEMVRRLIAFLQQYRLQLASLLSGTQLTALLKGMQELARQVPVLPPTGLVPPPPATLPLGDAAALVDILKGMPEAQREHEIYGLSAPEQEFVRAALAAGEAGPPPPGAIALEPPEEPLGRIHWPVIEEAAHSLASKNILSSTDYRAATQAVRENALLVSGAASQEALEKVHEALLENLATGTDFRRFRKDVQERLGEGTFLTEPNLEKMFRGNIGRAFSDGQLYVVRHPFIRSGFPYAMYHAIHDDRVRPHHLAMETYGLNGTAIYRIDDPTFIKLRPPFEWNCRCGWTAITVQMAADRGVEEARKWLATGVEPSPPSHVSPPAFEPPPEFRREGASAGFAPVPEEWQQRRTQSGQMAWHNARTGETRYQQHRPGEAQPKQEQVPTPAPARQQQQAAPRPATPQQPQQPRQPAAQQPAAPGAAQQHFETLRKPPAPQPASTLPGERELQNAQFENFNEGTQHGADTAKVTVGNTAYFFKGNLKREKAEREVAVSQIAALVNAPYPSSRMVQHGERGRGVVTPWLEGVKLLQALFPGKGGEAKPVQRMQEIEKHLPEGEVDRHLLMTYLLGLDDRHTGNYMISRGRLHSIDHELSGSDSVGSEYLRANSIFGRRKEAANNDAMRVPLSRKVAGELAAQSAQMAKIWRTRVGDNKQADFLEKRGKILDEFSKGDSDTYGALHKIVERHAQAQERQRA
jgi:SPP1 gp7 family putative phage head morphogenesis protein